MNGSSGGASLNDTKLVVCFPYNGDLVAPFMIEYLYDVVDKFVMVESMETFSGLIKPSYAYTANADMFKRKDKIHIICIERFPKFDNEDVDTETTAWRREAIQRNTFVNYLKDTYPQDTLVCVCDADEIPDKQVLMDMKRGLIDVPVHEPVHLIMQQYFYNFNWREKEARWILPYVARLESFRLATPNMWRLRANKSKRMVPKAGWHCSYFMSIHDIRRKLFSFSHMELNIPEVNNMQHIEFCVRNGRNLFIQHPELWGENTYLHKTMMEEAATLPWIWLQMQLCLVEMQKIQVVMPSKQAEADEVDEADEVAEAAKVVDAAEAAAPC